MPDVTRETYEDPHVVKGYIQTHAMNPKLHNLIERFSKTISTGKKVLDLGCGPGHDSYKFTELGFEVTGVDYSTRMIEEARKFKRIKNKPVFLVGNMRDLYNMFDENTFDAAWISASILHIDEKDVPKVLQGLHRTCKPRAKVYVGVKVGRQGKFLVEEEKYGKTLKRDFIFWEKDKLSDLLQRSGFEIEHIEETKSGVTDGYPTNWINFFLAVEKLTV